MRLSEALKNIADRYVTGTIPFYARQNPDPWQSMIDQSESGILSRDPQIEAASVQFFHDRALELIEAYRRTGHRPTRVTPADAFMMGPATGRVGSEISVIERICYRCEAKKDLKPEAFGEDGLQTRLVCASCRTLSIGRR